MLDKKSELQAKCEELSRKVNVMKAEGRAQQAAGASTQVLRSKAREVLRMEASLSTKTNVIENFETTYDLLFKLCVQVEALIELEWYDYVVRAIPEKQLPIMVKSLKREDLVRLANLIKKLKNKIDSQITGALRLGKITQDEYDLMQRTTDELMDNYATDDATIIDAVFGTADTKNDTKENTVEFPLPVEGAANTASTPNANTNKA